MNGNVSLRLVNFSEQNTQARLINKFYRKANITNDGSSNKSLFISVALPGMPSFFTDRQGHGAAIFRVSKRSGALKKGDHYYLDNLHKDHLEVFDKNGRFRFVLNLDGTVNQAKSAAALGRSIKDILK